MFVRCKIAFLFIMGFCLTACGPKKPPTPHERVKHIMEQLTLENYDAVIATFDPKLRQAFPRTRLEQNWRLLNQSRGKYQSYLVGQEKKVENVTAVFVTCQFEKGVVRVRATVNADGTLGSFAFLPMAK